MEEDYDPSVVNDACRLLFRIEELPSDFFNNPESFDNMFGAGRYALTDGRVLNYARGCLKRFIDGGSVRRAKFDKFPAQAENDGLQSHRLG